MTMPLDGLRVIDWTIWQQGPVCSVMLGDLGADVIKVEERVGGDPGRGVLRAQGLDLDVEPSVLTAFRRHECEFWWNVYDAQFAGSPSGAFVEGD